MSPSEDDDDWSMGEVVRMLKKIDGRFDRFEANFVRRDLHDQQLKQIDQLQTATTKWLTDVATSLERTNRDLAQAKQEAQTEHATMRDQMLPRRWVVGGYGAVIALLTVVAAFLAIGH